ncbi:MAG: hypothetical protein MJ154_03455 [Candidatus Saccharibacteria bacterium]|nr:hypothetical protein [Candidatus Saccharibacteria bacterium]
MSEEDKKYESNNTKIAITAIMSVCLGAAFIMALILFGMRVQNNINAREEERKKADEVITINSVDFDTTNFAYTVPKNENGEYDSNYLINKISKESTDRNYVVLNSNDALDDALSAIRVAAGSESISYEVEENFFNASSIIMVVREGEKLNDFQVKTVTRDADYNLQIDATEALSAEETGAKNGQVVFVKVRNIQPKAIDVKVVKEEE